MFIEKNIPLKGIIAFSGWHIVWLTAWSALVTIIYQYTKWEWMAIPWLPLSVIGTAVAFYVGFKNNQSYDRLWEARKIWGGIVNTSRAWGTCVKAYVTDQFADNDIDPGELTATHKRLIYRHIAWLYALRSQLLIPTSWEHINQNKHVARVTQKRQGTYGVGLFDDETTITELHLFLDKDEHDQVIDFKNTATQLIDNQSQDLKGLRREGIIEDFRHMELQNLLNEFYIHQGKCERIKKFPLPRQYGGMSLIFTGIFIFLLPFGMVSQFGSLHEFGPYVAVLCTVLISWIYLMMELVGDYSENPFEGMGNDIPMLSLCRTIEIDLREMLKETDLPPAIEPVNGVLM